VSRVVLPLAVIALAALAVFDVRLGAVVRADITRPAASVILARCRAAVDAHGAGSPQSGAACAPITNDPASGEAP
jgi:hypothetical protein